MVNRGWRSSLAQHQGTLLALALLALLTYLFSWRLWAPNPQDRATFPEKSDLTEGFFPPRYFVAHTLASGELPLWNPYILSGYPQFADPQSATFYPIELLFALLAGARFSLDTVAASLALHFFLAGAFAFFFLSASAAWSYQLCWARSCSSLAAFSPASRRCKSPS